MRNNFDMEVDKKEKEKILYISPNINSVSRGGREQLSSLNFRALKDLYRNQFYFFSLKKNRTDSFSSKVSSMFGYLDGLTENNISEILVILDEQKVEKVFINGSNLGKLAKTIKQKFPSIQIICFFHNVETKFFFDGLKRSRTIKSLLICVSNFLAEFKAVKYSDTIISLSDRDSNYLFSIFRRGADHIAPLVLEDWTKEPESKKILANDFALFVGGAFFANVSGIRWFVDNVMPFIDDDLYIVGKGFESFAMEFSHNKKVNVIGYVENLDTWYLGAKYSIAPIFEGSGMKTKVAESLMYGVPIIGTSEAFSGYEEVKEVAGNICNSADEFIQTISNFQVTASAKQRKAIFKKKFSYDAGKDRLKLILST